MTTRRSSHRCSTSQRRLTWWNGRLHCITASCPTSNFQLDEADDRGPVQLELPHELGGGDR
jgi:hypothetical protein